MTADDSVTTDIAAVLAEHAWPGEIVTALNEAWVSCPCGERVDVPVKHLSVSGSEAVELHRAHVAAAIAARLAEREAALLCSQCGEQLACMVKVGTADGWCATCLDEASERGGEVGALAEVERRDCGHPAWMTTRNNCCAVCGVERPPAQQPPDPLAEGVEALAAEWDDYSLEPGSIEDRMRDDLRALLSAREQQADGGEPGSSDG